MREEEGKEQKRKIEKNTPERKEKEKTENTREQKKASDGKVLQKKQEDIDSKGKEIINDRGFKTHISIKILNIEGGSAVKLQ